MKFRIEGLTWEVTSIRGMFVVTDGCDTWEFDAPEYDGALPQWISRPDDSDEYWTRVAAEAVLSYLASD